MRSVVTKSVSAMSDLKAFCPQCKNDVTFIRGSGVNRCPVCGFQCEVTEPPVLPGAASHSGQKVGKTLLVAGTSLLVAIGTALMIVCALAVAALAVLFAGCSGAFR